MIPRKRSWDIFIVCFFKKFKKRGRRIFCGESLFESFFLFNMFFFWYSLLHYFMSKKRWRHPVESAEIDKQNENTTESIHRFSKIEDKILITSKHIEKVLLVVFLICRIHNRNVVGKKSLFERASSYTYEFRWTQKWHIGKILFVFQYDCFPPLPSKRKKDFWELFPGSEREYLVSSNNEKVYHAWI